MKNKSRSKKSSKRVNPKPLKKVCSLTSREPMDPNVLNIEDLPKHDFGKIDSNTLFVPHDMSASLRNQFSDSGAKNVALEKSEESQACMISASSERDYEKCPAFYLFALVLWALLIGFVVYTWRM